MVAPLRRTIWAWWMASVSLLTAEGAAAQEAEFDKQRFVLDLGLMPLKATGEPDALPLGGGARLGVDYAPSAEILLAAGMQAAVLNGGDGVIAPLGTYADVGVQLGDWCIVFGFVTGYQVGKPGHSGDRMLATLGFFIAPETGVTVRLSDAFALATRVHWHLSERADRERVDFDLTHVGPSLWLSYRFGRHSSTEQRSRGARLPEDGPGGMP